MIDGRKIKCLYIIDRLVGFAGTEKHLYLISTHLNRKENFSCRIVAFNTNQSIIRVFAKENVTVRSFNLEKIYDIPALKKFINLFSFIKSYRPDIVQTFHFMSDTFGVCAAKLAGVPLIISSRRDMGYLKNKRHIYLNRLINPFIHKFMSVSNSVRQNLSKVEKIPLEKIKTIYNGVDLNNYQLRDNAKKAGRTKLGIKKNAFVLGIICILRPEKDIHFFLKAISELNSQIKDLTALIIGDGPMADELIQYSKKIGISDKTHFAGYVYDCRDYLAAMDILCVTSWTEGFSNVILEGMAMGKPVVATNVGGNPEQIVDSVTGILFNSGDIQSFVRSVIRLNDSPELCKAMGIEGRKRVEKYHSFSKNCQNLESFYRELLSRHKSCLK